MTPEVQREAMAILAELSALSPDVRLGQLLAHVGFLGEAHLGKGLGYIDDDELIAIMYRHKAELLARTGPTSNQNPTASRGDTAISGSPLLPDLTVPTENH